MYDGFVYGFRELADLGDSQYSILGGVISVTSPVSADSVGVDYSSGVDLLNAGCNLTPFGSPANCVLSNDTDAHGSGFAYPAAITVTPRTGSLSELIKGGGACWGVYRDCLSLYDIGPALLPVGQTFGVVSGVEVLVISLASADAQTQWDTIIDATVTLWNTH
jgi:hypothetical protein